jgi:glutamyl-tRNA reductase
LVVTAPEGILAGVSIAHSRATIDQLEAASIESQETAVAALLEEPGVSEAFVLQTCNRVEAYAVAETSQQARAALAAVADPVPAAVVRELDHEESLRHLLRVAAGLESLVLGEDQILGQVRQAYEDARAAGGIGPLLEDGTTKAIHVGERARTETAINEGVVSLASAAVRLAAERHGLVGATATVVGTGEMGRLAAKRLADSVDRLVLVNRTVDRAETLAETVEPVDTPIETDPLPALPERLREADIVISATASSEYVVDPDAIASAGETFVVDITRPRDVPPAADDLPNATVYDLDRLESVTEKTRRMRREAAGRVEEIVDEEFDHLLAQYKRKRADGVISAMYESAEHIKASELERTLSELDLDEEQSEAVESMADAIVSQLLAPPTNSLRDAAEADDWETIHTALQLFNPHFGPEDAPSPSFVAAMQSAAEDDSPADDGPESLGESGN